MDKKTAKEKILEHGLPVNCPKCNAERELSRTYTSKGQKLRVDPAAGSGWFASGDPVVGLVCRKCGYVEFYLE